MSFELNQNYSGFKLIKKEEIAELKSLGLFFEHEGTGAELLVLENDDDNKVFSATFRTPPTNDAGVAHILEHSVLCGSKNFPVKEPFVELMKGSLQTFLKVITRKLDGWLRVKLLKMRQVSRVNGFSLMVKRPFLTEQMAGD